MERARQPAAGRRNALLIYFGALIVSLTAVGILERLGYVMIDTGIQYLLTGLLFCSALAVCGVLLVNRIARRWLRMAAGLADGLLVLGLAVLMVMLFRVNQVLTPGCYAVLESPGGEKVVVMRKLNLDAQRIQARTGEADAVTGALEHLGYAYMAYPRWGGLFYNRNQASQGELEIGCASSAQLMHRWDADGNLHLYVENPEPGDGGELTLVLKAAKGDGQ